MEIQRLLVDNRAVWEARFTHPLLDALSVEEVLAIPAYRDKVVWASGDATLDMIAGIDWTSKKAFACSVEPLKRSTEPVHRRRNGRHRRRRRLRRRFRIYYRHHGNAGGCVPGFLEGPRLARKADPRRWRQSNSDSVVGETSGGTRSCKLPYPDFIGSRSSWRLQSVRGVRPHVPQRYSRLAHPREPKARHECQGVAGARWGPGVVENAAG